MSEIADVPMLTAEIPDALAPLREEILAELVLLSQIPSPTGEEIRRVEHILNRFVEAGVPEAGQDEKGNAAGFLPGRVGDRTIMLVAHLDTIVPSNIDHNVEVTADRLIGPGISDNATGATVISMLPNCLDHLGLKFDSNISLLGTVNSLDRSHDSGLRFHLENMVHPVDAGICIEGVQLGRLNYFSIGTLRGRIDCDVRLEGNYQSRSYGSQSAVAVLNHIMNRILAIEVPQRPFTHISINRVRAGVSYDVEPDHAELGFEVNSHDDARIDRIETQIQEIVAEVAARNAVDAKLDSFFRRRAGGIGFSHPLVKSTIEVMEALGISPDQGHSPSELSEFIARGIPAVTLGITTGEKNRKKPDHVNIEPILRGVAQIVGVLLAIDRGITEEPA